MTSLQVRDLPEDVHTALVRAAAAEHRSVAQQTVVELRKALQVTATDRARRQALLDRLAAQPQMDWEGLTEPADLIREDRDR
ncbi:FitA-like ribbon-helix-helix domain-containing protein [Raineyella sp. LH-20]|uniref:FitA-like ribbon-helix-helix domain-containing protein n=1 Tax=Raineyella sp. LH-20 TaxID=3081204 RepID=UPI0029551664|nr:hypothetical protein [Raineyella sp. LH-20]WOP17728.1 hypothetical protein R0146_10725 [Raineyella sp. LH-20]